MSGDTGRGLLACDDFFNAMHIRSCVRKGAPVAADNLVAGGQAIEIQKSVVHAGHGIAVDGSGLIADDFSREPAAKQIFLALVVGGQEEPGLRVRCQLLFHLGNKLFRGALSHGNRIVGAADMDAYTAGRKVSGKCVHTLLKRVGGHKEGIVLRRIKALAGEDIDPLFQCPIKVVVQAVIRLVIADIVVAEALACGKLVIELPGILQGMDVDECDIRLKDWLKQILKGGVQFRIQIPEDDQLFLSALRKLHCGIYHAHPIA